MASFEKLPGLPAVGPLPEQFARGGTRTYSEGYVVRFVSDDGTDWVGNFQRGLTDCDVVLRHPNAVDVLVIAGGEVYILEPKLRRVKEVFGGTVVQAHELNEGRLLVLDHQGLCFEAVGPHGTLWSTRRLSWDGFLDVRIGSERIVGKGWALDGTWRPFEVDLATGRSTGGSYIEPDGLSCERLNDPAAG
jgi:hypothetical protein